MLCCVSRRAIAGADLGPSYDYHLVKEQCVEPNKVIEVKEWEFEPDVPSTLLPCAICARTFMPQSLEKHMKICEQSANKKRKPFDSAKQRIQGTELAEFVPKRERKRHSPDNKPSEQPKSTWKQTHDDLLRAVRAARNEAEVGDTMQKQNITTNTSNAPTRSNEQGLCPTCNRHFGLKAYDRHVAWCKDRIVRVSATAATNVAKERLEARMKYRAPSVKNRRQPTGEKYSPGSAAALGSSTKTSPTLATSRAKESASAPNCKADSPVKQKIAVVRRPGHQRESSCPTVPMKSRPVDRGYRPPEDDGGAVTFRPPAPSVKRISHLPVPPLKHKRGSLEECNSIPSPKVIKKPPRRATGNVKREETYRQKGKQDEKPLQSARSLTANIVSARSMGHPKVNDVSINEDIMGFTVKPCNIHRDNKYTTWKQISEEKEKDSLETSRKNPNCGRIVKPQCLPSTSDKYFKLHAVSNEDLSVYKGQMETIDAELDKSVFKESAADLSLYEQQLKDVNAVLGEEDPKGETSELSPGSETINWPPSSPSLSRTYSFKDMADEMEIFKCKKFKPVRHSPRVEFCFGDPEKIPENHVPPMYFNYFEERNTPNNAKNVKERNVQKEKSTNVEIESSRNVKMESSRNVEMENSTNVPMENITNVEMGNITNVDMENITNVDMENITNVDVENITNVEMKNITNVDMENIKNVNVVNVTNVEKDYIKSVEMENFTNVDVENITYAEKENITSVEIENFTNVEMENITNVNVETIANVDVETITNVDVETITNVEMENIKNTEMENITKVEMENIKNAEMENIKNAEMKNITNIEMKYITNVEIENITNVEIENITNVEMERLANDEMEDFINVEMECLANVEKENITNVEMESSRNSPIESGDTVDQAQLDKRNLTFEASSSDTEVALNPFESLENRKIIIKHKEDSPKGDCEIDVQNLYNNTETVDIEEDLDHNNITASVSNTKLCMLQDKNTLHSATSEIDIIKHDKAEVVTKNLQHSPSFEQFASLDRMDDFCETSEPEWNNIMSTDVPESNESLSDNNQLEIEINGALNDEHLGTESPEDEIENRTFTRRMENEVECPAGSESIEDETEWMEMESNELLAKSMLDPNRSSTPFVKEDVSSNSNGKTYENFQPSNAQWEMEVDRETGSEMMYLIEHRDLKCPSPKVLSGGQADKLERTDSDDTIQTRIPSSDKNVEADESVESIPVFALPNISNTSPTMMKEQQGKQKEVVLPMIDKKEIASQINICNCSLEECPSHNVYKKESDEDCNTCCSEELASDVFLNENVEDNEMVEKPMETQDNEDNQDIEEINYNSNVDESLTTNSKKSKLNEGKHMNTKDNNSKMNFPEISTSSMIKVKPVNKDFKEIYKSSLNQEFDGDSDNSMEHHIKDAIDDLKCYSNKRKGVKQNVQNLRSYVMSESCVKMSQRVRVDDSLTDRPTALRSRRSKRLQMEHRIHESTRILNESSDSLESPMELPNGKRMDSVEVETIEEIGTKNRSIRFRILPEIRGTTVVVKEDYNEREKIDTYWEKASKASRNRLINLDPPYHGASGILKRNPKVCVLPPVPSSTSLIKHSGKDYDPFLLAEQQMNDLLSDTSEQSVTDGPSIEQKRDTAFPLSHSSAFAKYPSQSNPVKRSSLIAPPTEFDDLTSDFSSDTTETNSLSREVFLKDLKDNDQPDLEKKSPVRELGRRVIIDKSKALGKGVEDDSARGSRSFVASSDRARKILDKVSPKVVRPAVNRSLSVRAASAPKPTTDRKVSGNSHGNRSSNAIGDANGNLNRRNNNYATLSGSNLSLSSIVSSDVDIKRSNSVFDELMTSFEDENGSFASLKSLLKNDPLSVSSPAHGRRRNGQISDEELSSPESYKRQDHSKMSGDSAYSSLNRKYSHHGRSTNDVECRFEEEPPRSIRRESSSVTSMSKCKLSKFCHECGSKFPETAKFCCECGIRRLAL